MTRPAVRRRLALALLVGAAGLEAACTSSRAGSDPARLAHLHDLQVTVVGPAGLDLNMRGDRGGFPVPLLGGLVWIDTGKWAMDAADSADARRLDAVAANISFVDQVEADLVRYLQQSRRFASVRNAGSPSPAAAPDGTIRVEVREFGLRPALRRSAGDTMVQVGCTAEARIVESDSGIPLWTWSDSYVHGEERLLTDYEGEPELLERSLRAMAEELAIRISTAIQRIMG